MYNRILTNLNLILTRTKGHHLPRAPDPFGVLSAVLLEDPCFSAAHSVFWLTCLGSLGRSASLGLFTTLGKEITPSAHRYWQSVSTREEWERDAVALWFVLSKEGDSAVCWWMLGVPVWVCCLIPTSVMEHIQCRRLRDWSISCKARLRELDLFTLEKWLGGDLMDL